ISTEVRSSVTVEVANISFGDSDVINKRLFKRGIWSLLNVSSTSVKLSRANCSLTTHIFVCVKYKRLFDLRIKLRTHSKNVWPSMDRTMPSFWLSPAVEPP